MILNSKKAIKNTFSESNNNSINNKDLWESLRSASEHHFVFKVLSIIVVLYSGETPPPPHMIVKHFGCTTIHNIIELR